VSLLGVQNHLPTQQLLDPPLPFLQVHSPQSLPSTIGSFAINRRYSFSCYSPDLAVTPFPPVSSKLPSSTHSPTHSPPVSSPTSHSKSNKAAIAGGIVGAVALVLFTNALLLVFLRKRRNWHPDVAIESHIVESGPDAYSGLTMTQSVLPYSSAPLSPSMGRLSVILSTPIDSFCYLRSWSVLAGGPDWCIPSLE